MDNEIGNRRNAHLSKRPLTIDDLNLKQHRKYEDCHGHSHPSNTPLEPILGFKSGVSDDRFEAWLPNHNAELLNTQVDLSGSEFDAEHPFDSMSMPGVDRNEGGSSTSEQGVQDYGIIGQDNYIDQELIKDELQKSTIQARRIHRLRVIHRI